jgi:hypothetical protein
MTGFEQQSVFDGKTGEIRSAQSARCTVFAEEGALRAK